jgi:DNA gyrase/topoisomerase IV subunit B
MDAQVLGKTTLDPRQRTLLQVRIDEQIDAHNAFRDLLGKDPEPRYEFIMRKADQAAAEDLDV